MVKIYQIGIGQKSSGTFDGITYVTRRGVTYARTKPVMPKKLYKSTEARKRQAIFKMVQMHIKHHLNIIKVTFDPSEKGSVSNNYYHTNKDALAAALAPLAERYVNGEEINISKVETAICNYASINTESIRIASKKGYKKVYLTGAWPKSITLRPSGTGISLTVSPV